MACPGMEMQVIVGASMATRCADKHVATTRKKLLYTLGRRIRKGVPSPEHTNTEGLFS